MKTLRHYFISDDLDDLEAFEEQLEQAGLFTAQIHVLTSDDTGAARHRHLHTVQSLMKKDIIHSAEIGALIGAVLALVVLLGASVSSLPEGTLGWTPFVFLSIVLFGFCTWEGGLFGIQETNVQFRRFDEAIRNSRHLFFVDVSANQAELLRSVARQHPQLEWAGTGQGTPGWVHRFKDKLLWFIDRNLLSQSQIH